MTIARQPVRANGRWLLAGEGRLAGARELLELRDHVRRPLQGQRDKDDAGDDTETEQCGKLVSERSECPRGRDNIGHMALRV